MIRYLVMAVLIFTAGSADARTTKLLNWESTKGHGVKVRKWNVLDHSGWHACPRHIKGGNCGSKTLNTGKSTCKGFSWSVGVTIDLGKLTEKLVPGVSINGSFTRSFTACNTRSESVTCTPNRGFKGRAEVVLQNRWGRMRTEYNKQLKTKKFAKGRCGGKQVVHKYGKVWSNWSKRTSQWNGRGNAYFCKVAYSLEQLSHWPEKRYSQCGYRKI